MHGHRWTIYHLDWVLRQFGRVQRNPPTPVAPQHATRGATANQYWIAYHYLDQIWDRLHNHLLSPLERGVPVAHPWDCAPNYMEWFTRVSHLIIQNPEHRSTFNPHVQDSQGSSSIDPRLVWCLTIQCYYILTQFRTNWLIHTLCDQWITHRERSKVLFSRF